MKNIDLLYDIFDQAAMLYYDTLKINYLAALSEINKNLNKNEYDNRLTDKIIEELQNIYKPLHEGNFLNEEIRLALELYIVKGLKNINYPQNLMTPDFINYLFCIIINELFAGSEISIMDTNLGTGNLLAAVKNNYHGEASIIGIENDLALTNFASSLMEILQNDIKIYFQDALNLVHDTVDVVIGDLDAYDVKDDLKLKHELFLNNIRYFPYLVIASRIDNIQDGGYFIFLVDNDFFLKDGLGVFKKYLDGKVTLNGLIALPKKIVLEEHNGKSIIIGKKTNSKSVDLMAVEITGVDSDSINKSISKIKTMIRKIKEEI
jgi:hypothetical protein